MNYIDTETFSPVPINHGTYRYLSAAECMIVTYAFGDGPVNVWDVTTGEPMPGDLDYMLDDPNEYFTAHNAMFDRNVLKFALKRDVPIHRWRCSMVKAMTHGLPGGLDRLCDIFEVDPGDAKQKTGRQLIHLFCKPQAFKHSLVKKDFPTVGAYKVALEAARAAWAGRATRLSHFTLWQDFIYYAKQDTAAMRAVDKKLPVWNYSGDELALWHLDQTINDRGFCVDVDFAKAAIAAVDREQAKLATETQRLTHGVVESATKRDQLLVHIAKEYGVELPDMQMATLERRIADPDLPIELRDLLANRLQASSTSTSKYSALVRAVQDDGRLRGSLQFSGAQRTRRWAGRTFQPHNLPRPDDNTENIATGIEAIKANCEDLLFEDVMRVARNAIRGCVIAAPGKKLVISDLSNIEGRDAAWLAGEHWKLDAFRAYDDDTGPDLYIVAYAAAFNVDPATIDKHTIDGYLKRQIGKVMELMLQYEGGVGAFITGAATYGIDLDVMTEAAYPTLPGDVVFEAEDFLKWVNKTHRSTFGLTDRTFVTCESLKRLWRRRHTGIVGLWKDLKEISTCAIHQPGNTFDCRMFKIRRDGAWLRIRLPSGRYLCYPSPQVSDSGAISYMGINQYTKKWSRISTYGGKLFENACQAVAGDVLKIALPKFEARGYETVLTVHDEAVAEAPDTDDYDARTMSAILAEGADWTAGLPLAAAGFETYRYRKD